MIKDKKKLLIEVSPRFHSDIKSIAAKNRKTIKQLIIELLVDYINNDREKNGIH